MEDNNDKPNRFEWLRKKLDNPNTAFAAGAGLGMLTVIVACNTVAPLRVNITKDQLQEWIEDPTLQLQSARTITGRVFVRVLPDAE